MRDSDLGWREVGVAWAPDGWTAVDRGPAEPVPGSEPPVGAWAGAQVELPIVAEGWVREVADHLAGGVAIVLDYGDEQPALLRAHPHGTLVALRGHQAQPDPLSAPGTADLSVFVDFSRIRAAARRSGLVELAYSSQAEALGRWGFSALLEAACTRAPNAEAEVRLRLAAKNLLFGFENFRVLELAPRSATSPAASPEG